jgi:hypothetical protein
MAAFLSKSVKTGVQDGRAEAQATGGVSLSKATTKAYPAGIPKAGSSMMQKGRGSPGLLFWPWTWRYLTRLGSGPGWRSLALPLLRVDFFRRNAHQLSQQVGERITW